MPKGTVVMTWPTQAWRFACSTARRVQVTVSSHLIECITAGTLVVVLSHATFTTSNEMLARYSSVLYDLSLAWLAAWIFNLLIVELPRRRDRVRLYSGFSWMIGLMARSGLDMMENLARAGSVNINIDPQVSGVIVPANREKTNLICAAVGPQTQWSPIPGSPSCWELIQGKIQEARDYHRRLQPWLPTFDAEVSAAMNGVILSELSKLCDDFQELRLGPPSNPTFENMSQFIYEHWKACDELMTVHYSKVLPYIPGWVNSLPRRGRRNYTPAKHNASAIAAAHKAMVEQEARRAAEREAST